MAINSWLNPKVTDKISECVPFIQKALVALLKMEPASISDIPTGAKRMTLQNSSQWKIEKYDGSNWVAAGKLMHDVDTVDGYHAAITPAKNTIAVRNASGVLQDSITGNAATATKAAALSAINPVSMGGTGSNTAAGARTNLGVPPIAHSSTANTYGLGSDTNYGHVKLSDAVDGTESVANGTASTPKALKAVNDSAVHLTGYEIIAGTKIFTSNVTINALNARMVLADTSEIKGSTVANGNTSEIVYNDANGKTMGLSGHVLDSNGYSQTRLIAFANDPNDTTNSNYSYLFAEVNPNGLKYAVCPTPKDDSGNVNTSDYSDKIATTAWVTTKINNDVPPPFPSGTKMLFAQSAAPTGWKKVTTVDDAAIRVVSGTTGGGTGGSVAFSTLFATGKAVTLSGAVGATTLTADTMPSHTHSLLVRAGYRDAAWASNSPRFWLNDATGYVDATGGSGSHTHALTGNAAINLAVKYVDVILCQKS